MIGKTMNRLNIALIDDDIRFLQVMETMIRHNGHNVIATGKNGYQAIEIFSKHRPDVMFIDYNMPGMDGLIAGERIIKMDSEAKLVLCSGAISIHDLPAAYRKVFSVLSKPFKKNDIKQCLNTIMTTLKKQNGESDVEQDLIYTAVA
ncbi:MAG: response regulator [Verrucomicrobiota bacterium]|nr:response regulator [Verrucomicrobiota bacterium]